MTTIIQHKVTIEIVATKTGYVVVDLADNGKAHGCANLKNVHKRVTEILERVGGGK